MSAATCQIWVERWLGEPGDWQEIPVTVEYEFTREDPPTSYYPGAPEHLEILDTSIPLTSEEEEKAERACWEDVYKRKNEAAEP